jgi:1,2-dihydroxy-3-keto-5-methylthiopentene dioxygenase
MTTATLLQSKLNVYDDTVPHAPLIATTDGAEIARLLAEVGMRFERWNAEAEIPLDADHATILAAYASSVARVQRDGGYGTVDVLHMAKGTPNTAPVREKFLAEHAHGEDEVRFFVAGSGAFYLHLGGKVYQAICVRGDLISVPAGTLHWFDMGPDPEFTALRWFNNQSGWVPEYTGSDIAARFPLYE